MTKYKLGLVVAALAVAGAACGGDETKNNTTNNTSTNNTATNNTATNNTATNNTATNNTATNNTATNNTSTNNNPMGPIEPPGCDDPNPPARCSVDPMDVVWAPSSVINDFFVEGTADEEICCFDYTDDGEIDNSLGKNLASFDFLQSINDSVAESIATGGLVLVLEHDGLDDLATDDAFTVNFYIGEHDVADFETTGFQAAGSNPVLLNAASFDQGSQPQAYLPMAEATAGAVTAGPGSVKIEIELFDSPLQLTISLARIEANIDAANSALDASGVALTGGKLGGVVKIRDIFVAVNEFAAGACGCLGLGGADLVNPDTGACSPDADAMACETAMEATCAEVAGACNLFGAVGLFADVDLDGDGLFDSVSIGSTFTAVGATINGVAP